MFSVSKTYPQSTLCTYGVDPRATQMLVREDLAAVPHGEHPTICQLCC